MAKLRGLGRGLDALLSVTAEAAPASDAPGELALDRLLPGRYQPRSRIDETALAELADSIRSQGVIQPIIVRPASDGRYEILAGERRWRAAAMAGLASVPVVVRHVPDRAALAMALIENIQREDLNPLEQASGLKRLVDEFGLTHDEAARAIGSSRSQATNLLRLLALSPSVQALLREARIDMGHARALLALDGARQVEIANRVAKLGLSVRQTEQLVRHAQHAPRGVLRRRSSRDIEALERELSDQLATTVNIRPGRKGVGQLVIRYASLEHLEQLLQKLRA
ncbi:MAG: ParB/RepB/Spo0J family partition protein [Burkholderiales bacterium]|nr:ParB/RepB/Spo0J family partition protein [Burkholderiales bacterium]